MTGDGNVNRGDSNYLIRTTLLTEYGDTNLDHLVDLADYNAMASHYGQTGTAGWALGDFNGDKNVNFADYQILEAYFGFGTGGGLSLPPVPIPEPATLGLLVCGAGLLIRRRLLRKA
jgi:hypothetical protein